MSTTLYTDPDLRSTGLTSGSETTCTIGGSKFGRPTREGETRSQKGRYLTRRLRDQEFKDRRTPGEGEKRSTTLQLRHPSEVRPTGGRGAETPRVVWKDDSKGVPFRPRSPNRPTDFRLTDRRD